MPPCSRLPGVCGTRDRTLGTENGRPAIGSGTSGSQEPHDDHVSHSVGLGERGELIASFAGVATSPRGSEGLQLVLRPDLSSPEKQSKKEVLTPVLGCRFCFSSGNSELCLSMELPLLQWIQGL